jgi:hypothetical protein
MKKKGWILKRKHHKCSIDMRERDLKKNTNKEMSQSRPLICVSLMNNIDDLLFILSLCFKCVSIIKKKKKIEKSQDRREISLNKRKIMSQFYITPVEARAHERCVCVCVMCTKLSLGWRCGGGGPFSFFHSDLFVFVFV